MARSKVGLRGRPGPAAQPAEVLVEESATRFCLIVGSRGLGGSRGLLLGRIESVAAFAEMPTLQRTLGAGPRAGDTIHVEIPTHAAAILRMRSGPLATLTVSFETRGQYVSGLTVYGTERLLTLPDANAFTGDVVLTAPGGKDEIVQYETRGARETRGIGVEELALALDEDGPTAPTQRSRCTSCRPQKPRSPAHTSGGSSS